MKTKKDVRDKLNQLMGDAEIILHDDTLNTYAAYQVCIGDFEIWVNARNLDIITAQPIVNRYPRRY